MSYLSLWYLPASKLDDEEHGLERRAVVVIQQSVVVRGVAACVVSCELLVAGNGLPWRSILPSKGIIRVSSRNIALPEIWGALPVRMLRHLGDRENVPSRTPVHVFVSASGRPQVVAFVGTS
ncbi:MAG: hypothetical protein GY722_26035 [bacterium]|nr:hypothetical protein [bacterium]